jgi:hypothetical protein
MDVVVWLRSLGLGQYEAAFRENEINERVLPSLTLEDLKEIGVGPVGHRRILFEAIAALRADTTPKGVPTAQASVLPPTSAPATEATGERRYLTVMFCDLVGSTSISAQLDAEEWRDIVGAYLDAASAAVTEMGGHIAKKLGSQPPSDWHVFTRATSVQNGARSAACSDFESAFGAFPTKSDFRRAPNP